LRLAERPRPIAPQEGPVWTGLSPAVADGSILRAQRGPTGLRLAHLPSRLHTGATEEAPILTDDAPVLRQIRPSVSRLDDIPASMAPIDE